MAALRERLEGLDARDDADPNLRPWLQLDADDARKVLALLAAAKNVRHGTTADWTAEWVRLDAAIAAFEE